MKRAINFIAVLAFAGCAATGTAPTTPQPAPQPKKLTVISDFAAYEQTVAADPDKELIDVSTLGIRTDIRYATDENFMKKPLYPVAKAFVRRPVAMALQDIKNELEPIGLTISVFDGYRPYSVTKEMWEKIHNPDYVADPAQGSRHNRGAAVDLTIVYTTPGWIFRMPSGYDDFSPRGHHGYTGSATKKSQENREMLRQIMMRHGFEPLETEWWHYDFKGWEKYELLDIPFDQLVKKPAA